MKNRVLIIVDGHSMMYRACYARTPGVELTGPNGEPTKGTYIFTRTLIKLCRELQPSHFCVALDGLNSSGERKKIFPEYKAARKDKDPGILAQLKRMSQIVRELGIPTFQVSGFEADDIIATITDRFPEIEVVIISKDKDLHQLVSDRVSLFDPSSREVVDEEAVLDYWGVGPSKVVEVQTLMGDSTDGVPGVRGIGKKRAVALVTQYSTAKKAQRHATTTESPISKALAVADLSVTRALVSLRRDVPLPIEALDDLKFESLQIKRASPIFRALGFARWS